MTSPLRTRRPCCPEVRRPCHRGVLRPDPDVRGTPCLRGWKTSPQVQSGLRGWCPRLDRGAACRDTVLRLPGPGEGGDHWKLSQHLPNHCVLLSPLPPQTGAAASGLPRVPVCQRSRPGEDRRRGAASSGETRSPDTRSGRPGCARAGPAAADRRRQRSLAAERLGAGRLDRLSACGCNLRSHARGGPVATLQ